MTPFNFGIGYVACIPLYNKNPDKEERESSGTAPESNKAGGNRKRFKNRLETPGGIIPKSRIP